MKQATATPFRAQGLALPDEASASRRSSSQRTDEPRRAWSPPRPLADPKASVPFHVDNNPVMKPLDVGWDARAARS